MIGFIILGVASISLLSPIGAQEYREARPSRTSFRELDDDVRYEKATPTTPVPILKQIDKHNDDGSYTYGFEAADGSFKIETKEANGEVRGKYGYTDGDGKLHVVEYGANKYGFQPSGEGITVPPLNIADYTEEVEEEPRNIQPKQSRRPQPSPSQQSAPAWQQQQRAPAPAPAPARPSPPSIVYAQQNPVPQRPAFFAGAQAAAAPQTEETYDYDDAPPQRPAPRPSAPRPQPVQYSAPAQQRYTAPPQPTRAQYAPAPQPQRDAFSPSAQFRQATSFAQPEQRPAPRPIPRPSQFDEQPEQQQFFRPEPARAQLSQNFETQAFTQQQPAVRPQYNPKPKAPKARGGFLDQLEEQFSLPQGGNPTHDISFGFY